MVGVIGFVCPWGDLTCDERCDEPDGCKRDREPTERDRLQAIAATYEAAGHRGTTEAARDCPVCMHLRRLRVMIDQLEEVG